ncbi:WAT1-related protein At1g43650 [Linum grandiflorum]
MTPIFEHLKSTHKPYTAMLLVQIIYAGMALFSKAAISGEHGMNSFVFVTYRQAFATIALAPFALFIKRLTLSLNLYSIAINYTTATFAAATTNVIPAITFTMALLFRMERLSIRKVHGIAKVVGSMVGVSGALVFALVKGPALINKPKWSNPDQECCQDWLKGSLIMILANILWSLWVVLQGRIVKEYPAKVRLTTLQCAFSCIQSAVAAAVLVKKDDFSAWKLGWNVHLYSVAYCLWTIQRKGPVFTAIFTPLALIITAIFSSLVWHEVLYIGSVGGTVLLVAGLYLVLWGKNKEERTQTGFNGKIISNEEEVKTEANHSDEIIADSKEEISVVTECAIHITT